MAAEVIQTEVKGVHQVVRAVLITTDGYLCIGKRASGEFMGSMWCLIGGKAESAFLTDEVYRETSEETGLPVSDFVECEAILAATINRVRNGEIWRNNYFILELDDLLIPNVLRNFNKREFSEVEFVLGDDVGRRRFAFGDGRMVRDFFKYVGN